MFFDTPQTVPSPPRAASPCGCSGLQLPSCLSPRGHRLPARERAAVLSGICSPPRGRDVGGARNQVRSLSPRAIPFTGDWQEASQSRRAPAAPPPPIGWSGEAGGRDRGSGGVIRTAAAAVAHSRALTAVGGR